jgi:phospholipid/cholesterol/gamma-HCH transport system substrate-binding protein
MSRLERLYAPPEIGAPGKRAAAGVRRDLILAGLFVLAMAVVVAGGLALILPGVFGGTIRLYAYFPEAAGLEPGIHISQAGYIIGAVEGVEPVFPEGPGPDPCPAPDADGGRPPAGPCFRATLRIRDRWPIPRDSVAQLASAGLLQGHVLRILPGRDQDHPLGDGERIAIGGREADLVAQLARLTDSLQDLVEETIAPALTGIAEQIAALQELLGTGAEDPGNRDRVAGVFESLQRLSANLEAAVDPQQLTNILGSVEEVSRNLAGASATLTSRSQDVQQAVQRYGDLASDLRGLVKRSRPAIDRTLSDSQYLLQELTASLGPILEHIETATRNLAELSRDLRDNPAVVIQGRKEQDNARRPK